MLGRLSLFHATVSTSTACGHVLLKASASFQRLTTRHNASTVVKSGVGQVLPPLIGQMSSFNPPRTLQETLEVVRIPPTGRNVGPRVEHIEVTADGQLADVISTALQLPAWFVLELLRFGAVHYCPIMPNPATAVRHLVAPEHLQRVEQLIAEGRARLGRNPKLQHPKRVHKDMPVGAGGYVRVHVHPKRFPAAYSVDWKQRILANMPEYVVVNKPAGVQVGLGRLYRHDSEHVGSQPGSGCRTGQQHATANNHCGSCCIAWLPGNLLVYVLGVRPLV